MSRSVLIGNLGLLFGAIGFGGYIFLIVASYFGCCSGVTTPVFNNIVAIILALAVVLFVFCMVNNCCKGTKKEATE